MRDERWEQWASAANFGVQRTTFPSKRFILIFLSLDVEFGIVEFKAFGMTHDETLFFFAVP